MQSKELFESKEGVPHSVMLRKETLHCALVYAKIADFCMLQNLQKKMFQIYNESRAHVGQTITIGKHCMDKSTVFAS